MHPAIFSQFSGEPEKDFVWFGTWIVRKEHINPKGVWGRLRHVPGLRKRMVVALWNSAQFYPSTHYSLPIGYDALQISEDGNRARGFVVDARKTIKTVFRNSRYGQNTERELHVRTNILPESGLKVPRIYEHHASDDYIQFQEEFIPGRIFSHWRDSKYFIGQVSEPLLAVAERQGVEYKPLCDILDANLRDVILQSGSADPVVLKGRALLEKNPVVTACFSHGDLVSSNMIVSDDKVYLVDWERSALRYAGYDQGRLALKHPWNLDYLQAAKDVFDRHQHGRFTMEQAGDIRLAVAAARRDAKA
ncbi:MAG TPA: phosphotransferase [Micavibrio sp.]|nr:phosphotransferase [Micavibrio sp.]